MTSTVQYKGDLRCELTHVQSGSIIMTDAPVDNQGKGEAFSPTDLVATALGACMLTIMGIAARAHSIDIVGTRVEVQKNMASEPRRISGIDIIMHLPKSYSEKEMAILRHAALTCPVSQSLHPNCVINVDFRFE